jgi:hypothetical protein
MAPSRERDEPAVDDAEALARRHSARTEEMRRVAGLVRWMDDLVRVPGIKFGFGLDPILGAVLPGIGDAVTGVAAVSLVVAAIRRGVPKVVLARMLLNVAIDVVGGLVPVAGDVFDVVWRANYRNLALLERHQDELEPRARPADWLWVGGAAALVAVSVVAPVVLWVSVLAMVV